MKKKPVPEPAGRGAPRVSSGQGRSRIRRGCHREKHMAASLPQGTIPAFEQGLEHVVEHGTLFGGDEHRGRHAGRKIELGLLQGLRIDDHITKVVGHGPGGSFVLQTVGRDIGNFGRDMGDDAGIEGIQLHQGVLTDIDFSDLVDGHLGLHDKRGIVGHDVHQGLARADHTATGVDLEVDHLAADGRLDLQALFGVAQGADTFTGLDDVVLQFPGFTGSLFHKAVAQVFHAQPQFGIPLFGFGNGLAQSSPLAHVAGQIAFQLQDLGFFQIAFLVKLAFGPQLFIEGTDDGGLGPDLVLKTAYLGLQLGYLGLQQGKLAAQGFPGPERSSAHCPARQCCSPHGRVPPDHRARQDHL